ncbi:lipoyl(octanoyl) transferase LipB [Epidermidibacterium keratini]|uniref:Octanoyltransferase n=1 Tax=Epidermidibacterium keratini TaxID=1891644 RepID=A0A7L4YK45_9ACTN|nr:lipoyl(octanoyl) transferase LipB [Epidermidibacterium keratini]QHB99223.1 lipoyl(octanoyl) transferase LipB [Epidermidibacterium keratini]
MVTPELSTASTALDVRRLGLIDYQDAWDLQRELLPQVARGDIPDTVLLLEHPSVYTAGKRTTKAERPPAGVRVIDVDRGGRITWHGEGQLVGYPLVRLAERLDVVRYVRVLEQVLIDTCAEYGVTAERVEGRTGVWVRGEPTWRKIAAIGVRVAQGVTMHGFALNCDPDLTKFGSIIPCGITDADVTSLSRELGRDVPIAEVIDGVARRLAAAIRTDLVFAAASPPQSER